MRKLLLAPLALLVATSCSTTTPRPLLDPTGNGAAREQWMFDQRAYPFGEIPVDARRKALAEVRERERVRTNGAAATAATPRWQAIGPLPLQTPWPWKTATGRVKALAISPQDPNIVIAGSSSGGIWRSVDAGNSFVPVSDTHSDLSVGAVAFAPSHPNVVYAVSGSDFLGTGVLRSHDSGATWQVVDGPSFAPRGTANRMVVDPYDANRLWVAQASRQDEVSGSTFSSGLLLSEDGGFGWKTLFKAVISDFAAAPGDASTFLLGVQRNDNGGDTGVYRSTDGGATWTQVLPGSGTSPRYVFSFSPAAPSRVYMMSFVANVGQMHVSDNGGATWRVLTATLPPNRPSFLAAHPTERDRVFLGYPGGDLHVSNDAGATWTNLTRSRTAEGRFFPASSLTHIDQHALVFAPNDARVLYLGNDGGIYKSSDGGATFTSLAATLSLVQAYGIAVHPTDSSMLFLGTQDNGLERRTHGVWNELNTGDYGSIHFDMNDTRRIVTNYVYGTLIAFTDYGDRFISYRGDNETFGEPEQPYRIQFIAPFEQNRTTNVLYFGTWRLFTSTDFGRSWKAPAETLDLTRGGFDTISAIGLAPSDPSAIYTGSATGRVMRSRDGGAKWTDITGSLPQRYVKAFAVDANDANVAWIAFSGYRAAHVHRTTDGGTTWQAVSDGLPDVPVNALLLHGGAVYAGTDIGICKLDAGNQWQFFGEGMPPVVVTSFDVTTDGRIVAATYGRGAYELVTESKPRRRSVRH
jgi:photosystem II stability/assembly factor-like uncharacterized protein